MPNSLEEELRAVHYSIAETKRQMGECIRMKDYEQLKKQLDEYEKIRLELLKQMEVEI